MYTKTNKNPDITLKHPGTGDYYIFAPARSHSKSVEDCCYGYRSVAINGAAATVSLPAVQNDAVQNDFTFIYKFCTWINHR